MRLSFPTHRQSMFNVLSSSRCYRNYLIRQLDSTQLVVSNRYHKKGSLSSAMPKSKVKVKQYQDSAISEGSNYGAIFYDEQRKSTLIQVLAKPGAKYNNIIELNDQHVIVQIAAPPVDGEANTELLKFLSKVLDVRKSVISLDKGHRSRTKLLSVLSSCGLTAGDIFEKINSNISKALKRLLCWFSRNQIRTTLCTSQHYLKMHNSFASDCNASSKKFTQRSKYSGAMKTFKHFQPKPSWNLRMHEILMSDVSLPLPSQAQARFDKGHLESCSMGVLLPLVWDLAQVDDETTALLMELWRRMDTMTVEEIISVADIFFINQVHSSWYLGAVMVHMMEIMETVRFTSSQLTRLVFHVLDANIAIPPGFCLSLENCIIRHFDCLSLNQVAVICHSFFTSQTRIRSMDLLDMISVKLIQEFQSLNDWYLPLFMKTMRYSNFIKVSFYKQLGDTIIQKNFLDKFRTLAQTMHIAHTYASVRISHPALFTYILKSCCNPSFKFRLKDLSKLIWSSGTVVTNDPDDFAAIKKIITYLEHNISLNEAVRHPDNLVDLVNGLCFLNIFSDTLLNILFHPKSVNAVLEMGKNQDKLPQLSIIDHSLNIEHPSYKGYRLDKASQDIVASHVGNFSVEKELVLKKGLKQAVEASHHMFGKDKVLLSRLLPHFQSDIFISWDRETLQFTEHNEDEVESSRENKRFVRLALVILSNMQTSYDGKPLGMLHMKKRQLEILGYKPVLIEAEDAASFVFSDMSFIKSCILNKICHVLGVEYSQMSSNYLFCE